MNWCRRYKRFGTVILLIPVTIISFDRFFNHQYRQDEVFGVMIGAFTGLAIFISCLGLGF